MGKAVYCLVNEYEGDAFGRKETRLNQGVLCGMNEFTAPVWQDMQLFTGRLFVHVA